MIATKTAKATVDLWVVGAGGLLAGEFLRLAADHPGLSLAGLVTRGGGEELGELHPHLAGVATGPAIDLASALPQFAGRGEDGEEIGDGPTPIAAPDVPPRGGWADGRAGRARVGSAVLLALPHGETATVWQRVRAELGERAERLVVVDLSADHRLPDPALYERWYGEHPAPAEPARFAYGLPELAREALRGATRIAAPGCFATALQLATLPAAPWLDAESPWVYHGVTGSSGSGAKPRPGTHHPHRHGNLWAYGLGGHRHEAELAQALAPLGLAPEVVFVPHSGPFVRGIHLTATLPLAAGGDATAAAESYAEAYAEAPFVDVLPAGDAPDLRRVVGSNRAALSATPRGSTLVVTLTLDNVLKGGAGQALQALNLALGWPETAGLPTHAMGVL